MRIWQYTSTKGGLEKNLKLNTAATPPKPSKPNQNLVQVIATALNPVDYKIAEVALVGLVQHGKPSTPGCDFAGRLITPAANSSLKRGQLVFGVTGSNPLAGGGLSEYILTESHGTVALPSGIDPIDGATIGVAGLTAYQSIVPNVKRGDRLFINGGSGGTGIFSIQVAKALGCHVTTTCSTANVELCRSLGADEVVDYKKQDVVEALKKSGAQFDRVIDNVGADPSLYWRCHEYTKPEAVYVMIAGSPSLSAIADVLKRKLWPGFLGGMKRKMTGFFPHPSPENLEQLAKWVKEGKIKPVIDQKFMFEEAPKAFEKLKTGRAKGKVVVDVASKTYMKVWSGL